MNNRPNLYFIAIMLPQKTDEEIIQFKNDIAQRFQSSKALRTASHITLKAPFEMPAPLHEKLLHWFAQMNITVLPFMQEIKDFGAFGNKRNPVIYVQPVINNLLQQLQKEVLHNFVSAFPGEPVLKSEHHFSPHITIAYRDLHPHRFKDAWQEYRTKTYTAAFEVNAFQLLQHANGRWNIVSSFLLQPAF